jgi:hypothetical protein
MDHSADPVRAGRPPAVTEGTPDGPIVLVLDPAGAALPATWRDLADGGLGEADETLTDPPRTGKIVHVAEVG